MTRANETVLLTGIGTIRGRVSRNELCMREVQSELDSVVRVNDLFRGAPFSQVSIFVHLGDLDGSPEVGAVSGGVVEVAIARRFSAVRRRARDVVCERIREAAGAALTAVLIRHGLGLPPTWHAEQSPPSQEIDPDG